MTNDPDKRPYAFGVICEEYRLSGRDESRFSYGIAAYAHAGATGTLTVVAAVHDLTPDRRLAEELVERCNRGRLSPCQLQEVSEELL